MGALTAAVVSLAALQAVNTFNQSKAEKQESDFAAKQLEANARIADIQAEDAIRRGDVAAKEHRRRVRLTIGEQRANLAAQGLDLDVGNALEIQEDTAYFGAIDEVTIKNNAWREAWGYRVRSSDLTTQARFQKLAGKNKQRSTIITGGIQAAQDVTYGLYLNSKATGATDSGGGNAGAQATF